jgi:hypothetical protein
LSLLSDVPSRLGIRGDASWKFIFEWDLLIADGNGSGSAILVLNVGVIRSRTEINSSGVGTDGGIGNVCVSNWSFGDIEATYRSASLLEFVVTTITWVFGGKSLIVVFSI